MEVFNLPRADGTNYHMSCLVNWGTILSEQRQCFFTINLGKTQVQMTDKCDSIIQENWNRN